MEFNMDFIYQPPAQLCFYSSFSEMCSHDIIKQELGLLQIMAWHWKSDKPLFEPMMI